MASCLMPQLATIPSASLIFVLGLACGLWMVSANFRISSHKTESLPINFSIVGDKYPSAEVVGLDLSPIQPSWVPPNVHFLIDDVEDEWVESKPYDLIHMRHSCAYLKDVDRLLRQCYTNLRPGGWVEFSDFGGYLLCDDGTMPDDYPVNECFALVRRAMKQFGANYLIANEHEGNFKRAGFQNVQCRIIKTPVGPWPKVSRNASSWTWSELILSERTKHRGLLACIVVRFLGDWLRLWGTSP